MLMAPNAAIARRGPLRGLGQDAEVDAQDAVGAHLEQHAGEDDADRRGRLDVRVGQPGVEREHRDLDGEADEERHPARPSPRLRPRMVSPLPA